MGKKVIDNKFYYDGIYKRKHSLLFYLRSRYISFAHRNKFAPILSKISVKNAKILEIGFGIGIILMSLSKSNSVYGVELSESAIESFFLNAKFFNRKNYNLIKYSGEGIIPLEEKFDFVISSHVLEHVPDDIFLLQEMIRLLNDNGYLFLQVPIEKSEFPVYDPNHVRNYTLNGIKKFLVDNGLNIIELIPSGYSNIYLKLNKNFRNNFLIKLFFILIPYKYYLVVEKKLFKKFDPSQILAICKK